MTAADAAPELDHLIAEASAALSDLNTALAEQMDATSRVLDARHALAKALARLAHPTPPLRAVHGGRE